MSAQGGDAILLQYGAQPGAAQPGDALVLAYGAGGAGARSLRAGLTAAWDRGARSRSVARSPWGVTDSADPSLAAPWRIGSPQSMPTDAAWGITTPADRACEAPWGEYDRLATGDAGVVWGITLAADNDVGVPWDAYHGVPVVRVLPVWGRYARRDDRTAMPWGEYAALRLALALRVGSSIANNPRSVLPWDRTGRPLAPGWGVVIEPGGPPVDENGTIIVPIRRAYIVLNSSTLTVADTGEPIQHTGLSLQLDVDSWAWGWSASVPASYLATLRPTGPDGFVEVIATINGEPFRLLVETLARDRRFGRADLRIGGRSRSAWLASPHAPTVTRYNTEARTAHQLLEDALTTNGVSIGWAVDWQITDWLVPAGAWSHQGSYIEAAVRIAEAAGAVIQPHPTDQTLRVLHRYPATPWEWPDATPDIALPEDVVTVEGITWADKPRYDAVYLAGSIMGHVKRAGTSGGTVAPMVTDPLLTHADATRQRGRAILSDTGRQAEIRIALPVLDETGIIQPGTLIQYTEQGTAHRGIARAVEVQCGRPTITQTITVETHELEPV